MSALSFESQKYVVCFFSQEQALRDFPEKSSFCPKRQKGIFLKNFLS